MGLSTMPRHFCVLLAVVFLSSCVVADVDWDERICIDSQMGHTQYVEKAIKRQADVNHRCDPNFADRTPLIRAAGHGHADIVRLLVDHGAHLELLCKKGLTALLHSVSGPDTNEATVRILLEAGADVNAVDLDGKNALLIASKWAKSATTRALLEHGADVHFQDNSHQTAIMFAAQSASAATIKVLLEYGADPSKENLDHETPLLLSASFNTHAMAIATLLEAGARIDHRGKDGETALMMACRWAGNISLVTTLVDAGADMDRQDKFGRTALMFAAFIGNKDAVWVLMKAGADGNIVNEDGWTMDSIAIKQEHLDVISIINQFRYPQYYAPNGEFRGPSDTPEGIFKDVDEDDGVPAEVRALYENQNDYDEHDEL
mmetsp:Transcript_30407/g.51230  ORF Transcript_30407/g.51230 Transcript_30407/m.51230 type:complete len:375 (-) Transcript_30407:144-1268(-)